MPCRCRFECAADVGNDGQGLLRRQPASLEALSQALTGQELHGHVHLAVVGAAVVEEGDNVRVGQAGQAARLALKAAAGSAVLGETGANQFDRDLAAQRLLHRDVDLAHAAFAEQTLQPVTAGDGGSNA